MAMITGVGHSRRFIEAFSTVIPELTQRLLLIDEVSWNAEHQTELLRHRAFDLAMRFSPDGERRLMPVYRGSLLTIEAAGSIRDTWTRIVAMPANWQANDIHRRLLWHGVVPFDGNEPACCWWFGAFETYWTISAPVPIQERLRANGLRPLPDYPPAPWHPRARLRPAQHIPPFPCAQDS